MSERPYRSVPSWSGLEHTARRAAPPAPASDANARALVRSLTDRQLLAVINLGRADEYVRGREADLASEYDPDRLPRRRELLAEAQAQLAQREREVVAAFGNDEAAARAVLDRLAGAAP